MSTSVPRSVLSSVPSPVSALAIVAVKALPASVPSPTRSVFRPVSIVIGIAFDAIAVARELHAADVDVTRAVDRR